MENVPSKLMIEMLYVEMQGTLIKNIKYMLSVVTEILNNYI